MTAVLTHSGGIRLREVLPECQVTTGDDLKATSCCSDPHACQAGDLFVALCGEDADGHDFVYEAIDRGATAVVAERMLPVAVPVVLVEDTRDAYGRICQALVDDPTQTMTTIGIAGSHGKTTVAKLLASVLRAAGERVGVINSLENCDGFVCYEGEVPSSPPEMAHAMAEMQAAGCTHAIVEIDSRDLAKRRSAGLQLDGAILTNVRHDKSHLQNTAGAQRVVSSRIFDQLKPTGFAVINADDHGSQKILNRLDCPTITAAIHAEAEISATLVERFASEQTVLLTAGDEMIPLRTKMIGDHHLSNCLLVAAAALALGIDLPTVVRGLEAVENVPFRMERIECGQPFSMFVDSADSPDRLAACLRAARQVAAGRVICVANADGAMPNEHRPLIGRILEKGTDIGLTTTSGYSPEPPLQAIHDVIDGYHRPAKAHAMPDRDQAIAWALSQAQPGDCVLIAGCTGQPSQRADGSSIDDAEFALQIVLADQQEAAEPKILRMLGD